MAKYLTFGKINKLIFDKNKTSTLIKVILSYQNTRRIFLEPYLKQKLNLGNFNKIRFHGCQAVRHDDHIHLDII